MDRASIAGVILALTGIFVSIWIEGVNPAFIVQPSAFLVVFCGTMGAVLLQSRLETFLRGIKMLRDVFKTPVDHRKKIAQQAMIWHSSARRQGLLSLEQYLAITKDPFIAKGLRMVIDGVEAPRLKEILEADISHYEIYQWQAVRIWESAGGYSPTVGILGAVLGLIRVMQNLADPSKLGNGVALAFVATVYGVGFANLFFLPVAHKLKELVLQDIQNKEMLVDIFFSIAAGESTLLVEERILKNEKTKTVR